MRKNIGKKRTKLKLSPNLIIILLFIGSLLKKYFCFILGFVILEANFKKRYIAGDSLIKSCLNIGLR